MKKLIIYAILITLNIGCSFLSKSVDREQQLKEIDRLIEEEKEVNPRGVYRRPKTEEEIGDTPYSMSGKVKIITENGYKNYYNAYDNHLEKSIKLNDKMEKEGVIKTFYNNGKLKSIGYITKKEKYNGRYREYYETGELLKEAVYNNGILQGEVKTYYKNGKLKSIIPYKNGIIEGVRSFYYKNGNPKEKYNYIDGKENGTGYLYYKNGKIKQEENYLLGKRDGKYRTFYENGNPKEEGEFKEGRMSGSFTLYYEDGKIKLSGFTLNGLLNGEVQIYSQEGEMKKIWYKNGKIIKD